MEIVFTIQKTKADNIPESPPRTQHEINKRELRTPSWTVFTKKQNELFVQQVVQDAQGLEGKVLHYSILCLNESSAEDDFKNPIVNWLFNITLTKISIHMLLQIFT